jgi:hypothetical protein
MIAKVKESDRPMVIELPTKTDIDSKINEVYLTAKTLVDNDCQISGPELADALNRGGFRTALGRPFKNGRGIYSLISRAWNHYTRKGDTEAALYIALAYTTVSGVVAYKSICAKIEKEDTN